MKGRIYAAKLKSIVYIVIVMAVASVALQAVRGLISTKYQVLLDIIWTCTLLVGCIGVYLTVKRKLENFVLPDSVAYEGHAVNSGILILISVCFFIGIPIFSAGLYGITSMGASAIIVLIFGVAFVVIGIVHVVGAIQSKLLVEEKGLVWAPVIYLRHSLHFLIPFDELDTIKVSGRVIRLHSRNFLGPLRSEWLIIENPKGFVSSIILYAPSKLKAS